ncbi:prenyltransferase/squalene oxidase repeat-containing protein [Nonomuraea phyllanthi]|uniref:prenyltransferase/squalene oxidase repeat-containing protein n=1 Tax=Nonomuraea phyllanthi TaxID=2219224 RepID=UPI001D1557C4|nr:prenyltransferase/squalene oxidase repeat-containing protein [Nonomuraea phyllanthi]
MNVARESVDVAREANSLIATLMAMPWGQVSASVYETGRLVTLAPWLTGHGERIDYLTRTQRPDGAWGAPGGYSVVPTLSATEALLTVGATEPAGRGLAALRRQLPRMTDLPDMPAADLIVPALIALINAHPVGEPLPLPPGLDSSRVERVRRVLSSGAEPPQKLLHALEVAGPASGGSSFVRPTVIGTVGASPAATAAWLGGAWLGTGALLDADSARSHLEAVVARYGGPVPVGLPITVFERGWVLSWLARAGVPVEVPPEMVADLRAAIGPGGTPAGAGLPPDADTTSVALYALALHGMARDPESLLAFDTGGHFCTWQGEDGFSISVNAHVLDAFGAYAASGPDRADAYADVRERLARLLVERQRPDGSWDDRWHASPYYATLSCVLSLSEYGGPGLAPTVARARAWVLSSQRPDGSWGRWEGTPEETAYAMQTLLLPEAVNGGTVEERHRQAAARGHRFLQLSGEMSDYPPLWHDKDLYTPIAVVQAAILAARYVHARMVSTGQTWT